MLTNVNYCLSIWLPFCAFVLSGKPHHFGSTWRPTQMIFKHPLSWLLRGHSGILWHQMGNVEGFSCAACVACQLPAPQPIYPIPWNVICFQVEWGRNFATVSLPRTMSLDIYTFFTAALKLLCKWKPNSEHLYTKSNSQKKPFFFYHCPEFFLVRK